MLGRVWVWLLPRALVASTGDTKVLSEATKV